MGGYSYYAAVNVFSMFDSRGKAQNELIDYSPVDI